jgi:hypothetical protein
MQNKYSKMSPYKSVTEAYSALAQLYSNNLFFENPSHYMLVPVPGREGS